MRIAAKFFRASGATWHVVEFQIWKLPWLSAPDRVAIAPRDTRCGVRPTKEHEAPSGARQERHRSERRPVCLNDPVGNPRSGVSAERPQLFPASVFRPKMRRSAEPPLRLLVE